MKQKLIYTNNVGEAIDSLADSMGNPSTFIITDANTAVYVLPELISQSKTVAAATTITIKAGDVNKTLTAVQDIWKELINASATRNSLIINVGGGVVSDLGGFAASTFKRGIRFINIPTTLLGAVDASVGGKTGLNFLGLKNEIGTFSEPEASIVSTIFFKTLHRQELLSGYAEMLKHGLLESDTELNRLLDFNIDETTADSTELLELIKTNMAVKVRIVEEDFRESGLRKALNLGHTAGHAFEAFALKKQSPVPHGYAVAWGCVVALVLSHILTKFPAAKLQRFASYVRDNYGVFDITCDDYPALLELMGHDKKNTDAGLFNFTLMKNVGKVEINHPVTHDEVNAALDIYRDLMGI